MPSSVYVYAPSIRMHTYYILMTYLMNSGLVITTSFGEEIIECMPCCGQVSIFAYWKRFSCPFIYFKFIISGQVKCAEIHPDKTTVQPLSITCKYQLIPSIEQLKFGILYMLNQCLFQRA